MFWPILGEKVLPQFLGKTWGQDISIKGILINKNRFKKIDKYWIKSTLLNLMEYGAMG